MKRFTLSSVFLGLQLHSALAAIRHDLNYKNVPVAEMDPTAKWNEQEQSYSFVSHGFEQPFLCERGTGKQITHDANRKFIACCLPGQALLGSEATAFDCCAPGHDLVGCGSTGYGCCPTGQEFDGKVCKSKDPPPVVPTPVVTPDQGTQKPIVPPPEREECKSDVEEGKCYQFKYDNGELLGFHNAGWYTASKDSKDHQQGKFQFCKTAACDGKGPVNPGEETYIRDIHGAANSGRSPKQWLDKRANGDHIRKTDQIDNAGKFTISKWTKGKHCLGGLVNGVSHTCPSQDPSLTFTTLDNQVCIPVTLTEVPCDIHATANNCMWNKGSDASLYGSQEKYYLL